MAQITIDTDTITNQELLDLLGSIPTYNKRRHKTIVKMAKELYKYMSHIESVEKYIEYADCEGRYVSSVYEDYVKFCTDQSMPYHSNKEFSKILCDLHGLESKVNYGNDGKRKRQYIYREVN